MKKIKNLLMKYSNKKYISIVMAFITYISLCSYGIVKSYDILSWLILILLIFTYNKIDISNKILKKEIIILSLLFSSLSIFGGIAYSLMENRELSVFKEFIKPINLLYIIGFLNLYFMLLTYIIPKLYNYNLKKSNYLIKPRKLFLICFIIMLLAWLPYYLNFYPGIMDYDSFTELGIIVNKFSFISDHHPVLHIIFMSIPFYIGFNIFGNMTAGIGLITIFQIIIMASIFSSFIVFLYKRKISKLFLIIILCYYSLLPVHGYYSISIWKDIIFSGSILLLIMETIKILEKSKNNELEFKNMISFLLVSLLCIFFRNNAIYMYFIFCIVTLIIFRKEKKIFLIMFGLIFGIYLFVKGPVFMIFNVSKSETVEYIGIPIQQIGRMAFKKVSFNEDEKEMISKLLPVEDMAISYNPKIADTIKFNLMFNQKELEENKLEYLKLWLNLVFKYPGISLESYAISTLGYWYPNVLYWSVEDSVAPNKYNIETERKTPVVVDNVLKRIEKRDFPILNIEWSIGLCFWIILIFSILSVKINGIKGIYPFILVIGIWLTMMIASPVFSEYRYVYGAYTSLPLLMLSPYIIKNLKGK